MSGKNFYEHWDEINPIENEGISLDLRGNRVAEIGAWEMYLKIAQLLTQERERRESAERALRKSLKLEERTNGMWTGYDAMSFYGSVVVKITREHFKKYKDKNE